jgi:Family of unknown function (DUF6084)
MTALRFTVSDIVPEPYAVTPNLLARLRIEETTGAVVHALALRCQVRVEPNRRRYDDLEEQGLLDLFGARERWADTMRSFAWLHTNATVPGFTGDTVVDLVLTCTYDVEVAGAKYLQALGEDGEVPLTFLFSGTVFTRGHSRFEVEQVPWHHEAGYRLPVRVWRDLMSAHFPGQAWLRVDRDTLAALARYRATRMHTSWDETLTALLAAATEVVE